MVMTEAAMKQQAEAWWGAHSTVGTASVQAPSATFTVNNFFFDRDGNSATKVDTAKIMVGQSVLWQWIAGTHTVTNGTGSSDPGAGTLFDQPSDSGHQQFTFTFNNQGTFQFFCRFHELSGMKGVVVVSAATSVEPISGAGLGFLTDPAPNPTTASVGFRFSLRTPGRARAEVYDARGRRVAIVLDRVLAAGPFDASWNGHTRNGIAGAGVYYLRLRLPGFEDSRRIVVTR